MARKLTAVIQRQNANRHTERGLELLDRSIERDGWIGAITVAADGETFDGSARIEVGKDFDNAIIVESDGTKPIIHRRIDIPNADDPRAVRLGVAANRIPQVDLEWDASVLAELSPEELGNTFSDGEIASLLDAADKPTSLSDADSFAGLGKESSVQVRPVLLVSQSNTLESALRATSEKNRAEALMEICESYLREKGQFNPISESEVANLVA